MVIETMYRFSVTGHFGYAIYRGQQEFLWVSGACLPDNPIEIHGNGILFRSTYQDRGYSPIGIFQTDSDTAQSYVKPTTRLIHNEFNTTVATLAWKQNHYILSFNQSDIEIRNRDKRYWFLRDGQVLAIISQSKADRKDIPKWLTQKANYTWENYFDLTYDETLPDALVSLFFAFPMLRFDFFLREKQ